MSDNWVVQNLEKALNVWNDKLSEIWQLITQSPTSFKGGTLWNVVSSIHGVDLQYAHSRRFCENGRSGRAGDDGTIVRSKTVISRIVFDL